MPGVEDRLLAAKAPRMVGYRLTVLADGDPFGIGVHLDRAPYRLRITEYLFLS